MVPLDIVRSTTIVLAATMPVHDVHLRLQGHLPISFTMSIGSNINHPTGQEVLCVPARRPSQRCDRHASEFQASLTTIANHDGTRLLTHNAMRQFRGQCVLHTG